MPERSANRGRDGSPDPGLPFRDPYHHGERAVQEQAGVAEPARRIARAIRGEIPDRAAEFLARLTTLVIGVVDTDGRPWASLLLGRPGFVNVPDPETMRVGAVTQTGDPAADGLREGSPVGTLGIHFRTRRRMRVNGTVGARSATGWTLSVQQAYANCQKYISSRADPVARQVGLGDVEARRSATLSDRQIELVNDADTFFISSGVPGEGADASHRGGDPGFVRATHTEVVWPDYSGNSMFNTLGNIHAYPRAGLTFLDFTSGSVLQTTGEAAIEWIPSRSSRSGGGERLVHLELIEVVELRCGFRGLSAVTPLRESCAVLQRGQNKDVAL